MMVDVSAFLGTYPFRQLRTTSARDLLAEMDRLRITQAWVGHLAAPWHRDPREANDALVAETRIAADRLIPVPTVHPGLPQWPADVAAAAEAGAPAVRLYPMQQGLNPAGREVEEAVRVATEHELAVVLTVRFEDLRQRHPLDAAGDLPAAAVRGLARLDPDARLLVTHADRSFVEEVHFGLTPDEAETVLWECSWIWGAPFDDFAAVLETVGDRRFTFGTGLPLRIGEGTIAKLDLLEASASRRARIAVGNLREWYKWPAHRWLPSGSP